MAVRVEIERRISEKNLPENSASPSRAVVEDGLGVFSGQPRK